MLSKVYETVRGRRTMHELAGLNSELKGNDKHLVNINHLIVGWEPIHSKSINKFNASFELGFLPARIVVY